MGRIPRWRMGDGFYHVYNRAINSAMILSTDDEKNLFADLVRKKLTTLSLNVYNYFHFAIEVLDIRALSAFIRGLSSSYSKTFRARRHTGYGPLWQGRYKSILVQKDNYLFRLGRYIEQNPVRAGLVVHAADWSWSSAASYLSGRPDGIVDPARQKANGQASPDANKSAEEGRQKNNNLYFNNLEVNIMKTGTIIIL